MLDKAQAIEPWKHMGRHHLEHALVAAASNPGLLPIPSKAFQLGTVWYGDLFAAKDTEHSAFAFGAANAAQTGCRALCTSSTRT